MRLREILENNILATNLFFFSFSVSKKKEDGTMNTSNYTIDIPDVYALMSYGNYKVNDYIQEVFEDETLTDAQKYGRIRTILNDLMGSLKYKWGALIDSLTLYYNPLYNVDAKEITTEDIKKRQRDITDKFGNEISYTTQTQYGKDTNTIKHGNNTSYTETMQYGLDETTHTTGTHTDVTTHKTNPFNDSDTLYSTGQDELAITTYDDKDSRAIHTDTATYNPHTDVTERDMHTDTTTYNPHADTHKIEDAAHKDEITKERHGNIGVTKSTELLRDSRELAVDYYPIIMKDILKYISVGY